MQERESGRESERQSKSERETECGRDLEGDTPPDVGGAHTRPGSRV